MASAKDEVAVVYHACARDVLASTMMIALEEVTAVVVTGEIGFDGLNPGETMDWMTARLGPQVLN